MATITSANAVFTITVPGVFSAPQQLQGYAADDAFAANSVKPTEVVMGVDGNMSVGFVTYTTEMPIHIMPDSPSSFIFEQWLAAMASAQEAYTANGNILLPSIKRSYTLTKGALTGIPAIPSSKKLLQAREFMITWQTITGVNI